MSKFFDESFAYRGEQSHSATNNHTSKILHQDAYDRIAQERKEINQALIKITNFTEEAVGFGTSLYGIFGSSLKTTRYKHLTLPESLMAKLSKPTENLRLHQLHEEISGLAMNPKNARSVLMLTRETEAINKAILFRSQMHSLAGLGIETGASYLLNRFFFEHDTPGNGSAVTTMLLSPLASMVTPGNFMMKATAAIGVGLIGKFYDHVTQPYYVFSSHDKKQTN